jgi:hypothetical protein
LQFLAPERIAHAHGEPYSGPALLPRDHDADSKQRLQVFTPKTSFTPEAGDWQKLVQAPQPLKLEITSAFFGKTGSPWTAGHSSAASFRSDRVTALVSRSLRFAA